MGIFSGAAKFLHRGSKPVAVSTSKPKVAFPFNKPFLFDGISQPDLIKYLRESAAPLKLYFIYNRREKALALSVSPFTGLSHHLILERLLENKTVKIRDVSQGELQLSPYQNQLGIGVTKISGQAGTLNTQLAKDQAKIEEMFRKAS